MVKRLVEGWFERRKIRMKFPYGSQPAIAERVEVVIASSTTFTTLEIKEKGSLVWCV